MYRSVSTQEIIDIQEREGRRSQLALLKITMQKKKIELGEKQRKDRMTAKLLSN